MTVSTVALVAAREVITIGVDIARHTKDSDDAMKREYLITDIREMRQRLNHIEREVGIVQTGLGS